MIRLFFVILVLFMYTVVNSCHTVEIDEQIVDAPADSMEVENKVMSEENVNNKMENAVQWATKIAEDSSHGYSQGVENATSSHPYTGSREGPDYDCSSLVYHALNHAGVGIIAAWQNNPAYWNLYSGQQETGDADTIWPDLQVTGGFTRYEWSDVKNSLQRGDILCNPQYHVAIYIGDGKTVEARGVNNPVGGDWVTGDQGGEIDFYNAYGRGWTEVYRYTGM
ncbi:NlpC/P60 family protein [Anaerovibrio lipolyticus DSM 3074]|uniref:NlpC/P60 domain-containing protein n=2 Tax=Anaerovibrio lipolyticus TaxID=82374 RepID=A0A0B2K1N9_9FIRM|nr:NlpC/P60 family protein [Anaerovibrio lipolyticus]KHM52696.1 hypothetical protein NZ47_03270 [Anaerovibrio lipolyticus]SHJ06552.1 NlpC/P60 family protein [Anaerovibrio lipolyticus DSM 3074]